MTLTIIQGFFLYNMHFKLNDSRKYCDLNNIQVLFVICQ